MTNEQTKTCQHVMPGVIADHNGNVVDHPVQCEKASGHAGVHTGTFLDGNGESRTRFDPGASS